MDTLNPLAKTARGDAVLASKSVKADGPFTCPGCDDPMILRRGEINTPHFAHKGHCGWSGGGGEGPLHRDAGIWMAQNISKWQFRDKVTCSLHPRIHTFTDASSATINTRCDVGETKFFLDVGVHYADGKLEGAVEIYHHHKTDDAKGNALTTVLTRPIIEVSAEDVFECDDWTLNCCDIWPRVKCAECTAIAEAEAMRKAALPPKTTKRPCHQCRHWLEQDDMHQIETHDRYRFGFVCRRCAMPCATCSVPCCRLVMCTGLTGKWYCDDECRREAIKAIAAAADAMFSLMHAAWAAEVAARNEALTWSQATAQDKETFQQCNVNRRRSVARMLPEPTRSQPRLSIARVWWSKLQRYVMFNWMQRRALLLTHLNHWIKQMRHEKLIAAEPKPELKLVPAGPKAKAKAKAMPVVQNAASRKRKTETELHQRKTLMQMVHDPRLLKQLTPPVQASLDRFFVAAAAHT